MPIAHLIQLERSTVQSTLGGELKQTALAPYIAAKASVRLIALELFTAQRHPEVAQV